MGFLITAVVSILLPFLPVYNDGQTLLIVNGNRVFGVLAIPVLIALAALAFARLDPSHPRGYNRKFTVTHFFDLMNFLRSPAGTRWAALFYTQSLQKLISLREDASQRLLGGRP
jgi:hypothetical protein